MHPFAAELRAENLRVLFHGEHKHLVENLFSDISPRMYWTNLPAVVLIRIGVSCEPLRLR
jgi:hypothetical protein